MSKDQLPNLTIDVVEHILFPMLCPSTVVSCIMVCRQWRKLSLRCNQLPENNRSQQAMFISLFRDGVSVEFLEWFSQTLKFPLRDPDSEFVDLKRRALCAAAEGKDNLYGGLAARTNSFFCRRPSASSTIYRSHGMELEGR
jgi:hypothetical protein